MNESVKFAGAVAFNDERIILEPYGDGNSGVTAFAIRERFMIVRFRRKRVETYVYDRDRPGPAHLDEMKRRARSGKGLTTYINRQVGAHYFRKLD
jgi:hypothetical protein